MWYVWIYGMHSLLLNTFCGPKKQKNTALFVRASEEKVKNTTEERKLNFVVGIFMCATGIHLQILFLPHTYTQSSYICEIQDNRPTYNNKKSIKFHHIARGFFRLLALSSLFLASFHSSFHHLYPIGRWMEYLRSTWNANTRRIFNVMHRAMNIKKYLCSVCFFPTSCRCCCWSRYEQTRKKNDFPRMGRISYFTLNVWARVFFSVFDKCFV